MAEKKYYWLKMTDQFFEDKAIKKLRKIAGGDTYTIIYLKMLLTAIKQGNKMYFEGIEDDFMEELALELDEDSMSWKHLFVAWANEFEELHGSKNWNEIDEDYYETIERFAEEKIMGWAGKKKRIVVGRHMEGITLNPLEWLLSNDGAEIMTFNSVDEAKGFLKGKGYQEEDMEFLRFVEEWM